MNDDASPQQADLEANFDIHHPLPALDLFSIESEMQTHEIAIQNEFEGNECVIFYLY